MFSNNKDKKERRGKKHVLSSLSVVFKFDSVLPQRRLAGDLLDWHCRPKNPGPVQWSVKSFTGQVLKAVDAYTSWSLGYFHRASPFDLNCKPISVGYSAIGCCHNYKPLLFVARAVAVIIRELQLQVFAAAKVCFCECKSVFTHELCSYTHTHTHTHTHKMVYRHKTSCTEESLQCQDDVSVTSIRRDVSNAKIFWGSSRHHGCETEVVPAAPSLLLLAPGQSSLFSAGKVCRPTSLAKLRSTLDTRVDSN